MLYRKIENYMPIYYVMFLDRDRATSQLFF